MDGNFAKMLHALGTSFDIKQILLTTSKLNIYTHIGKRVDNGRKIIGKMAIAR